MNRKRFRTEKDIMGPVKVPFDAYYGIQTIRASKNFPISGFRIHPLLNCAILQIKLAASSSNMECKILDNIPGKAIVNACKKIIHNPKKYEKEFILDVYQAGAGTPWHMNINEVIANVALESLGHPKGDYKIVDPHNHVNMSQSTNDVIPTAMRIAGIIAITSLYKTLNEIKISLRKKSKEFKHLMKASRTHLMDAVPITLGDEFGAWASALEKRLEVLQKSKENLKFLHIGGTAVGTGINAPKGFDKKVIKHLRKQTGLRLNIAKNKFEQTEFMTDFLDLSSALRGITSDIGKIANDIRLMSSGPMVGLNEITLPQIEPGSSIMPGKFNPSMAEMINMVCFQVNGNDKVIEEAVSAGQLDLNVMTPVIAHNLFQSLLILNNGIREFNNRCLKDIKPNKKVLKNYYERTPFIGTKLNLIIGYDKTAEIIRESIKKGISVKDIVINKRILSKKEVDRLFRN